jgi:hypothetical protein
MYMGDSLGGDCEGVKGNEMDTEACRDGNTLHIYVWRWHNKTYQCLKGRVGKGNAAMGI